MADERTNNLPLEEVFRALAEDTDDRRLRRVARQIACLLAEGADLPTALAEVGRELPPYLHRALAASASRGQTPALLAGLARHEAARRRLRRRIRSALLYPMVVLVAYLLVVGGLMQFVVPEFQRMFTDFDLPLPGITYAILGVASFAPIILLGACLLPVVSFALGLWPGGRRLIHWLRTAVPLLGNVWIAKGLHEFASILGALVGERVVLDDALACTVASLRDRNLARATRIAARKCEGGAPLSQSLAESIHFDRTLPALIGWGEEHDDLPGALRQAMVVYEQEIELQAVLLGRIVPPLLLATVATTILLFVVGLFVPLVSLVSNLSG